MKNIILVGFMGTGKSAVGRALAKKLKWPFIDLDERIEKEARCSVAQIFSTEGEAGFRQREARAVEKAAKTSLSVIATGGGVMLDQENVRLLKESGTVVCLTAQPEVIAQRTLASLPSRPLLNGVGISPRERIEELLKVRAPFYAQADVVIDTSDKSTQDVVEEIFKNHAPA